MSAAAAILNPHHYNSKDTALAATADQSTLTTELGDDMTSSNHNGDTKADAASGLKQKHENEDAHACAIQHLQAASTHFKKQGALTRVATSASATASTISHTANYNSNSNSNSISTDSSSRDTPPTARAALGDTANQLHDSSRQAASASRAESAIAKSVQNSKYAPLIGAAAALSLGHAAYALAHAYMTQPGA